MAFPNQCHPRETAIAVCSVATCYTASTPQIEHVPPKSCNVYMLSCRIFTDLKEAVLPLSEEIAGNKPED